MTPSDNSRLSVIVPAYNAGRTLGRCLEALLKSTRRPVEIIVIDDSSTDGSPALVQGVGGVRSIVVSGGPHGPGPTRNRGAEAALGDILVFIDADVAVHPDTLARLERCLLDHPEYVALFGSYDTDPPVRTWVSLYKNLLHHYVHQKGDPEASTFWSGCGAIYRDVFRQMGGFDENFVAIEDIELGARLKGSGYRTRLCREIQVTHLKHWTFSSLLRADIFGRAVPWTRLIVREKHLPSDLNLTAGSRLSAAAAWAGLLCLALGLVQPWFLLGTLVSAVLILGLNAELYRFFARCGGLWFALVAVGLHSLYFLYSSLTFLLILIKLKLVRPLK